MESTVDCKYIDLQFAELEENVSKKKEERQRMRSEMSDVSIGGRAVRKGT